MFQCFIFKNFVEEQMMLNVVRITTINKKHIMKYAQNKYKINNNEVFLCMYYSK